MEKESTQDQIARKDYEQFMIDIGEPRIQYVSILHPKISIGFPIEWYFN